MTEHSSLVIAVKLLSIECHGIAPIRSQQWSRLWLVAGRQQAIAWANIGSDLWCCMMSLGYNKLIKISHIHNGQCIWVWVDLIYSGYIHNLATLVHRLKFPHDKLRQPILYINVLFMEHSMGMGAVVTTNVKLWFALISKGPLMKASQIRHI